jgi:hypothetical protein
MIVLPPPPPPSLPPISDEYEWILLTDEGNGAVSFYNYYIIDDPSITSPLDLDNLEDYEKQGSVKINGVNWNYWGDGVWRESNQDCAYSSTTQCVYPLNTSDYMPVTGAVQFDASKGPKIPSDQDQLIYIEVVDGSYPFQDGGLLVNSRDWCPACKSLQVDILLKGNAVYFTYNLGDSAPTQEVNIWAAMPRATPFRVHDDLVRAY